ncbi:MAG TPA: TolC family protein [Flavobacteriales bacterium]|nr:TolC family protein [Flavobacteriales bacterium]HRO40181.1 TolC family protein [Flavobacteriales bacterium]HRP80728.1 TolC family protein [Flavobacteriales bacterium]HRQ84924.1 TolC family protein [Flavobacteriales bacterium]
MRTTLAVPAFLISVAALSQGPVQLSLQQAMDQAAAQSYSVQYSDLEAAKAEARIKEILGVGLPQVAASGGLNNYLKVPTQVIPNFFGNEPPTIEIQLGIPWMMNGGVQLQQLLFDGSYLVGLQATRALKDQAHLNLEKARHDARNQAAKAYYAVLAAEEGARLVGQGIPLLEKSAHDAQAMLDQGFLETTDVDRLTIQLADARNSQHNLEQQVQVARAFLGLVLGLPAGTPVALTDSLGALLADPAEQALAGQPYPEGRHIEEKQAQSQLALANLEVRHQQAAYLPTLGGFINYQQQFNSMKFDPHEGPWFPSSMWGLSLNVPIFSSGMRLQRVKQARITAKEAEVNRQAVDHQLRAGYLQQQAIATAADDSYRTAKANMELAGNIFRRTSAKFTEGMASSFELTQEHANFLAAQQHYVQSVVNLMQARADMRKALDMY